MSKKFNFPKRIDNDVAETGVLFAVKDEYGNDWGSYLIKYFDLTSTRGQLMIKRVRSRYLQKIRKGEMTEVELGKEILITELISDWKLPKEITGKANIPYSHSDAREFFNDSDSEWLVETLISFSKDITNYAPVEDAAGEILDNPVKN